MKSIESSEEQIREFKRIVNSFHKKAREAGITKQELRTVIDANYVLAFTKSIDGQDWYRDILEMHEAQEHYIGKRPHIPTQDVVDLRKSLIREEVRETTKAMRLRDLEGIADGIADSIVVLLGTAISYGIDIRPIWDEVHRTNMAKTGGPKREDGKALKPEGWEPPGIASLLEEQGATL